jgi:hypothetical protein
LRGGALDIAAMPSQAVEPLAGLVQRFSARYPEVTVNIRAAFTPREVVELVRTGACELGLLATPGPLPNREVAVHPMGEQRFILVTPPDGSFKAGRPVNRHDRQGHRLIVGQRGTGMRTFVNGMREQGIALSVAVESEHRVSILPLVLKGVGPVVTEAWRELAERSKMGRRGEWLPWALLIVGSLASLAANVAVANPTTVSRLIAAWPSFAFVGTYHLLQSQLRIGRVDLIAPIEEPATDSQGRSLDDGTEDAWRLANPGRRLQWQAWAWAWALANRSAEGQLPAGAVIAERFNRGPRWGRLVKRAGDAGSLEPPRDEAASGAG